MSGQVIGTYEEAVDYLYRMPSFTGKNTQQDTVAFLERLGNPDRKLRIIHVAGTNGKGSTCAYLSSVLQASGKKVAMFTSPHLTDIRERIRICGEMVGKEDFLRAFLQVYELLDHEVREGKRPYHPSFFEYLFFMAVLLFAEAEPDYCILETGLGGRLDATNSVFSKELAVITRISLEHVEYLGNTVAAIAGEKAGIIYPDAPVVYSQVNEESDAVFEKKAADLMVKAYPVSKNRYAILKIGNKSIDFSLQYHYDIVRFSVSTNALYQVENAALAVRAAEVLDESITPEQVRQGLQTCFWAGRMEEVLPEVYVDGAHNADGIRAFLETVASDGKTERKLLFSVVSDKDYESMLEQLAGSLLFSEIAIAHMKGARAASLKCLEEIMCRYPGCAYTLYEDVGTALHALVSGRKEERIYISGSLYLVGEIKELVDNDQF